MLNQGTVMAMVAVSDIENGKKFYGEKLGLNQVDENPGGVAYDVGGSQLFVYHSGTAGTGEATAAAIAVDDVDAVVADLKSKGISFERYELPGVDANDDVHTMGDMKAAWFKDPDGNIIGINSR